MDLDRHIPRDSTLHRFDPRLKLILAFGAIAAVALLPPGAWLAYGLVFVALVLGSTVARLGPWRLLRGSWVVLPFAIVALPLLFTRPGEPLASFELGPLTLTVTQEGLRDALSIAAKSWLSVQVALLLAFTTPFPSLIEALRWLRLPAIMVSIISFMYRYLAVIGEEAGRMNRARASRSAIAEGGRGGSVRWRARVTGSMVGSLFIRSYERSERVHAAMQARGFEGVLRGQELPRPELRAVLGSALLLAAIAGFVLAANAWTPRP
jgi:cobalt/nickel transport system permease protein